MIRNLKIQYVCLFIIFQFIFCGELFAEYPNNFREAKQVARVIWADHRVTAYCDCRFDRDLNIDHESCGYQPRDNKRAKRVEWEHVLPLSWFGQHRTCWKKGSCASKKGKPYGGRGCCEQTDPEFKKMYLDLHNLVPAVGEVNAERRNYRFGEFYPERREAEANFNGCAITINRHYRVIEPKNASKGMIARVHLYMAATYSVKLSNAQKMLFNRWDKQYPPSEWEVQWNHRVHAVQGTDNTFISEYESRHTEEKK